MLCSWIGRISIVKMFLLLKANYRINVTRVTNPKVYFIELTKIIIIFLWKHKISQVTEIILWRKNKPKGHVP